MAYGTDQGFLDWLAAQDLTAPVTPPALSVHRQIGSAYVDAAYEWALTCSTRAGGFDQVDAWPRKGHRVNGELVPDDHVPLAWVHASYRAAWLNATNPGWATAAKDTTRVTRREQVDTISREFFAADEVAQLDAAPGMNADPIINGMVKPWLCSKGRSAQSLFRVI